jgi:hypothetical protein
MIQASACKEENMMNNAPGPCVGQKLEVRSLE